MFRTVSRSFARTFSSSAARADLAKMSLIGRVGGDLEVQTSKNGVDYIRYPLAVQTSKTETSWFNLTVFDPQAINFMASYLTKGATVYVEADASIGHYENDKGENRTSLQLVQSTISPVIWKKKVDETIEATE